MDLIIFALFFILFWATLTFTHYLLVSCWVHPYLNLVKSIGLRIKPFYFAVYWTRFSHGLTRFAIDQEKLIKQWMHLGVFASIFMTPISICILIQTITNLISLEKNHANDFGSLEPFLPGVNLPISEIFYYVIALLISTVFHEFGHFIAALREGIRVNGVGLSMFAFIPIAYVDIAEDQLKKLAIGSQLRIFCAGVWHNLVLGLFTAALLLLNPYLLSPLYTFDEGIVVANIQKNWGASSSNGIERGDVIIAVNRNCQVSSKEDWKNCFLQIMSSEDSGFCVPKLFVDQEQSPQTGSKCCDDDLKRHLCFENFANQQEHCLPARSLLQSFTAYCNATKECSSEYSCLKPKVEENPGFKLLEVRRKDKPAFLFWGHPYEVYASLTLVNYQPKMNFLPTLFLHRWETLLRYITAFSLALALLNSIPCYIMDGKWITKCSLDLLLGRLISKQSMNFVQSLLSLFGTFLVISGVSLGFYSIILKSKVVFA